MENEINSVLTSQNEIQRRQYLAIEARDHGPGGISAVSRASGVSRTTIRRGLREIESGEEYKPGGRIRAVGGGRKRCTEKYPGIKDQILKIIKGATYGEPEKTTKWISLSQRKIAHILEVESNYEIKISHKTVGRILKELDYCRQQNKKNNQIEKES